MDPAFIIPIFRSYLLRTVSKTVHDTLQYIGESVTVRDLYRESLYASYEMQPVRKVVYTQKVLDIVSRKVSERNSQLC
jgi:hypothetical protein